jgi:hypothetical protein
MASIETSINMLQADLMVCRVTLQILIIRMISSDPPLAEERLLDLKSVVTTALGRMEAEPNDFGTHKTKQLAKARGDQFFQELENLLSTLRKMRRESGRN